jgi:hypothetical protein
LQKDLNSLYQLIPLSAPEAEHNETAWVKRMPQALKFLLGAESKK